jgi:hypothetical protein
MSKNKRLLIGGLSILAIVWPLVYDQVQLGHLLNSQNPTNAEPAALGIIFFSIIIGSLGLSFAVIGKKWELLILAIPLGIISTYLYFIVSLFRNVTF